MMTLQSQSHVFVRFPRAKSIANVKVRMTFGHFDLMEY